MFWLGLILSVAYVPGYTGATIPTGWAVLFAALPWALWRGDRLSIFHWLMALIVAYAGLSLLWAPAYDGVWGLLLLCAFALAFHLGTTLATLRPILSGLAIGLGLSSLLSIIQAFGLHPVLQGSGAPGLYFNAMIHGEVLALAILALSCEGMWRYIPALLPGLYLSHSRGAYVALGLGLVAQLIRHPVTIIVFGTLAFAILLDNYFPSDVVRTQIWMVAASHLTLWGEGIGSFLGLIFSTTSGPIRPEYVHNDFLQLGYELGLGAVPLLLMLGLLTLRAEVREWPVLVAFTILALFSFPSHTPVTLFLGALVTGRCARAWCVAWDYRHGSGRDLVLWLSQRSRKAVPV